jgi:hypothetical protein
VKRDTQGKARRKAKSKSKLIYAFSSGGQIFGNMEQKLCSVWMCVDGEEVICHYVLRTDQLAQIDIGLLSGFTSPTLLFIALDDLNKIYWNEQMRLYISMCGYCDPNSQEQGSEPAN